MNTPLSSLVMVLMLATVGMLVAGATRTAIFTIAATLLIEITALLTAQQHPSGAVVRFDDRHVLAPVQYQVQQLPGSRPPNRDTRRILAMPPPPASDAGSAVRFQVPRSRAIPDTVLDDIRSANVARHRRKWSIDAGDDPHSGVQ